MNVGVISPQALYREVICALLAGRKDFAVVMEMPTVSDLSGAIGKPPPEILILHAPDLTEGPKTVRRLRRLFRDLRILMVTDGPSDEFCRQALEVGARGCLSTSDNLELFVMALEKVAHGEAWAGHHLANLTTEGVAIGQHVEVRPAECLNLREWEVLSLLASGCSDKEIASCLRINTKTAKSRLKSVYEKLQVRNRIAATICYFHYFPSQRGTCSEVNADVEMI